MQNINNKLLPISPQEQSNTQIILGIGIYLFLLAFTLTLLLIFVEIALELLQVIVIIIAFLILMSFPSFKQIIESERQSNDIISLSINQNQEN